MHWVAFLSRDCSALGWVRIITNKGEKWIHRDDNWRSLSDVSFRSLPKCARSDTDVRQKTRKGEGRLRRVDKRSATDRDNGAIHFLRDSPWFLRKEFSFMCVYDRPVWWDREIDRDARPIRADVREAAQKIWKNACGLANTLLSDTAETAEIMEECVARVSQSLDSRSEAPYSQNTIALLWVSFRNSVLNRAAKRRREEPIADSEILEPVAARGSLEAIESQIDLEKLVRRLSARSRTVLILRYAGYDWKEIAALLRITIPAAKNNFRRELREAQMHLAKKRPH
jgi:RNA polymerase sigma factor (sigma-70 family)